jgi:hypothetical protein
VLVELVPLDPLPDVPLDVGRVEVDVAGTTLPAVSEAELLTVLVELLEVELPVVSEVELPVVSEVELPVVSEVELLACGLPAVSETELPAVSVVEPPVSCTPSAKAVKPEVPTTPPCEAEGAVGAVMLDCLLFTFVPSTAGSEVLIKPAPL